MKKLLKLLTAIQLSVLLIGFTTQKAAAQVGVSVSFQTFYDNLSPYGQWVSDPQYGNVFVPQESADFRPYYSRGHWAMTDYGNTWVSDDSWGWACYHYGRWTYDAYYGWVWVPGSEWAPAWVDWRYGGGQCGWAPLGPGISIGVSSYNCPDNWWVFVGPQYLYNRGGYGNYWRGPEYNRGYINQTTIINNTYVDNSTHVRYNYGPRSSQIQSYTHQAVPVYHVAAASGPGAARMNGNAVNIFRPAVNRSTMSTAHPANVVRAPQSIGRPQAVQANHQPAFNQQLRQGSLNNARVNNISGANNRTQSLPGNRVGQLNQPGNRAANIQQNANQRNGQFNNQAINRTPQNINRANTQPQANRTPAQTFNNRPQIQQQQNRNVQQQFNRTQPQQQIQRQAPQQQQFNRVQQQQQGQQRQAPQQQQFNRVQQQPQVQQPRPQAAPQMQHTEAPHAAPGGGGGGHMEGGRR